ncbi:MAG TPA: acyl-CoA dehydratase activase [Anaerolineales bacterium]|nr:acyl-CoA dehydratase activase [Anaerolineales bacterium]
MYAVGIDIGSTSGEAVILNGDGILAASIVDTGYNSRRAAELALEKALADSGLTREQLGPIVATGYGRIAIEFANRQVTEISCYAKGTAHLFPDVCTVIDIGGQDSKVIAVGKNGKAVDFAMNDKCAAGTGRFLEVTARALQLDLADLGEISARAARDVPISSICTVFAESEVVTLVAEGAERADIVAGLHRAIARRVGAMVKRIGPNPVIAFAGGVAKNSGVKRALEETLGVTLVVPPEPQIVGALGAALIARNGEG